MTAPVEVSVIVPARNVATWIPEQLSALAAQEQAPLFEVLVSDNGSTDATRATVAAWSNALRIRVIDSSQKAGASHARNVGVLAARGELLLFCDADDRVGPYWIRDLSRALRENDGVIAAGSLRHEPYNDDDVLAAYSIAPDPVSPSHAYSLEEPRSFAGYLPTVAGCNFGMRRRDYLRFEGMDASYPGGSEETDFVWRAQEGGMRVVSTPSALVDYRLRASPRAIFRQQRIQQCARMLLCCRYAGKMNGPSVKVSLLAVLEQVALLPRSLRTRRGRLTAARIAGGHVGALQGMVRYRLLKAVPAADTMQREGLPKDGE